MAHTIWKHVKSSFISLTLLLLIPIGAVLFAAILSLFFGCVASADLSTLETPPINEMDTSELMARDRSEPLPRNYRQTHKPYLDGIYASVLITTLMDSGLSSFCSGFVVKLSDDSATVITNYHCLASYDSDQSFRVPTHHAVPQQACSQTLVNFTPDRVSQSGCKAGTIRYDSSADLAAFEVTPPKNGFPDYVKPIAIARYRPRASEPAYMIHFPHDPRVLSTTDLLDDPLPKARITKIGCKTIASPHPLRWHPFDDLIPFSIEHTCFLLKGSSGSALISSHTHKVIGVNWGSLYEDRGAGGIWHTSNAATSHECLSLFLQEAAVDCSD